MLTSKISTAILYTLIFIFFVPLSFIIENYLPFLFFPFSFIIDIIYSKFQPYYLFFGSWDDSLLEFFLFFIHAWYFFAIFYFLVQLIIKYIFKYELNLKLKLKNLLLNFISFIFFYILFFSINVSKTILEWIRQIICNITYIDFCNYKIHLFGFPDEKIIYYVFLVWFLITIFFVYLLYKVYIYKKKINWKDSKRNKYYLILTIAISLISMLSYVSIYPFSKKNIEETNEIKIINHLD